MLLTVAVGHALGCSRQRDASERLDRVESPVPVRLVDQTSVGPDLGIAPERGAIATLERAWIEIALEPNVREPIGCDRWRVQVAVDPGLGRYAVRCHEDVAWDLTYVWRGQRVPWAKAMPPGHRWLRADGFPNWSEIADLPTAAEQLLLHANPDPRDVFGAVRESGGAPALASLLEKTPAMVFREPLGPGPPDPWLEALASLDEPERARVVAALRAALAAKGSGEGPAARAVGVFAEDDDSIADDLAARLLEVERKIRQADRFTVGVRWRNTALERLMRHRPEAAAEIGCERLSHRASDTPLAREAAALGSKPCPALDPQAATTAGAP
jgi:hypothetical protein